MNKKLLIEQLKIKIRELESPQKIKDEIKSIKFTYDGNILNTGETFLSLKKDNFMYMENNGGLELKIFYKLKGDTMVLTITYQYTETRDKAYEILYKMLNEVWKLKN